MATLPDPEDGTGTVEPRRRERWRQWGRGMRPLTRISLATRLALVALLVTLVSLVVAATVGLYRGSQLADDLAEDRVVASAAAQADAVELYVAGIGRQVASLATSPGTRDAIAELAGAYLELAAEPVDSSLESDLTQYYLSDVVPALEAARGDVVGASAFAPDGAAAIYLQSHYTVPRVDDAGATIAPELVLDPGDGSTYSEIHGPIHQTFGEIASRSDVDDLYLIDARSDVVVYSARKRTDFATSLALGPLSGTAFARMVESMSAEAPASGYAVADFTAYAPAFDRPTSFVASPVEADGEIVGFVAVALSVDLFDEVLSASGAWPGFGEGGEAYLVGADGFTRSTARAFQESPSEFLADSSEERPGQLTDEQRRTIAATGTTALVQSVNRSALTLAMAGAGTTETTNFSGTEVLTAFRPVDVEGVGWVVFADVPIDELDEPVERYARNVLFAVAMFVVIVTFVAVRWSNRLMAPIRAIATRLRSVRVAPHDERIGASNGHDLPANSPEEYDELSANIDQMLARLRQHQHAVTARSDERARLLRQFLPAAVARRTEEDDGEVVDHVGNASVVVIVLDGVGNLVERRDAEHLRRILADVVDEADSLASELGLERVKITGGMYVAVCGVSRPYLDHAPRSVAFALGVRDLVAELTDRSLSIRAGVDDGEVSVGLAGRSGLVYDAWGDAVTEAERLATSSPQGAVTVSAVVRRQLPAEFLVADDGADDDDSPSVVTGRVAVEADA